MRIIAFLLLVLIAAVIVLYVANELVIFPIVIILAIAFLILKR